MSVPLLDLKAQYAGIRDDVKKAMDDVCDSQYFILGPTVTAFEEEVAQYCGVPAAVGVSSGTDALLVAMMALNVGPGDAVITTSYSFFATAGCVVRLGATPVFVDIDPETYNLDPAAVKACLESWEETHPDLTAKVLMPVHLYGQSADMDALNGLAADYGLTVIEDACQAIGAEYPSADAPRRAGAMGDAGCFSFFPSKNLGGFGDGGMVTVCDEELAEQMRRLRNHGAHPKYYHQVVGGNFRLDALQAAVLSVKLKHLDAWHAERRANAARYRELFVGKDVVLPVERYADAGIENHHIYNQFVIRVPGRDDVRQALLDDRIGCEIYYPVPLHLQECFAGLGYEEGSLPNSEKAAAETLALPIYPELTDEQQTTVADAVCAALSS